MGILSSGGAGKASGGVEVVEFKTLSSFWLLGAAAAADGQHTPSSLALVVLVWRSRVPRGRAGRRRPIPASASITSAHALTPSLSASVSGPLLCDSFALSRPLATRYLILRRRLPSAAGRAVAGSRTWPSVQRPGAARWPSLPLFSTLLLPFASGCARVETCAACHMAAACRCTSPGRLGSVPGLARGSKKRGMCSNLFVVWPPRNSRASNRIIAYPRQRPVSGET